MKTDLKTDSVAVTSDTPGEHNKTTRSHNQTHKTGNIFSVHNG